MRVILNLSDQEMKIALEYKKHYNCSMEQAFKNALFEKIANDFDDYVTEKIYQESLKKYPLLTRREVEEIAHN